VRTLPWVWLTLILSAACRPAPGSDAGPGDFEVGWKGAAEGSISGNGQAVWCGVRRALEIRLVQGDTGVAIALYPTKTLAAGVYRVTDPAKAESLPPSAGVAVRWPTQNLVQGFQGDSGVVQLERSGSGLISGKVTVRARSVVDTQRIRLSGSFQDLTVKPDTRGCPPPDSTLNEAVQPGQDD
jgi:hypothetical protein